MTTMLDRRCVRASLEIEDRAEGQPTISGYAAVYYDGTPETQYEIVPGFVERIMPGAFDRVLSGGSDVRALRNHDPNMLLGRESAGTLALKTFSKGLRYTIKPGETSVAADTIEMIRRGDLDGSSFSFRVASDDFHLEDEVEVREITDFGELFDVGPVTFPAYGGTTAGLRSLSAEEAEAARERFREESRRGIRAAHRRRRLELLAIAHLRYPV